MACLYVSSSESFSGKSALCIGLGKRFLRDGLRIGYMKPVNTQAQCRSGVPYDADVEFAKRTFGLPEPEDVLSPVAITPQQYDAILKGTDTTDFTTRLLAASNQLRQSRDVIILEGGYDLREGYMVNLRGQDVAALLKAQAVCIARYEEHMVADQVLAAQRRLEGKLIGAVINAIPRQRMEFAQTVLRPFLERRGVPILGCLPRERLLQAVSIGELAEGLDAQVMCCHDCLDELVEHLMVGAMTVDSALSYFRRRPNKAVITGGDRSDIHLAALETSTRCLILTGNLQPSRLIVSRAEELGVPILLTRRDTLAAVEIAEQFFGRSRFHQEKKIQRFSQILDEMFDFDRLYAALELKPKTN
jgi:BioD-like phosphotransacetylase family protein